MVSVGVFALKRLSQVLKEGIFSTIPAVHFGLNLLKTRNFRYLIGIHVWISFHNHSNLLS
uniref:Uncharacterized protein n=1 Tax=Lepeophtheirus salmonis TaxID=72036 RepID=A0A0K2ULY7_LEPSM